MPRRKNIDYDSYVGMKIERLTILQNLGWLKPNYCYFSCRCDCGTIKTIPAYWIITNRTKSCGCLAIEKTKERTIKHGKYLHWLYRRWREIKRRCQNSNCSNYKDYGGRGICIYKEWEKFENFYSWAINNCCKKELTIERIDNNGNYEPSNCRWAPQSEQGHNKRNNILINFNNKTQTLSLWCKELSLPFPIIRRRIIDKKWDHIKALTTPIIKRTKLSKLDVKQIRQYLKVGMSQNKIAAKYNINQSQISNIKRGTRWANT